MVRVVAEAGHENDRRVGRQLLGAEEHLVPAVIGHLDVGDHEIEIGMIAVGRFERVEGFGAVGARRDVASLVGEQLGDTLADRIVVVSHEDALALHGRIRFAPMQLMFGAEDRARPSGAALDTAADPPGGVDDLIQLFANLGVGQVLVA